MRIQLICAAFPPFGKGGGPATSALIARGLVAAGHQVEVITASDTPLDETRDGYHVRSIGSPNLYADYWQPRPGWKKAAWHVLENFNPRAYLRMRREIRRFAPDLVATVSIENVNVATWLAARRAGVPVLHFLHSYFLLCWRGSLFRDGARCVARCGSCRALSIGKEALSRHVDAVAGESRFVIDAHRAHGLFGAASRFVVPTPATADGAIAEPAARGQAPVVTIGYIGNISAEKGVATLAVAARALVARHGEAVRFVVAGSGAPALMAELAQAFPGAATRFLGWCRPEDFYAEVDLVVVPSLWDEPYGRVSVEPLQHGIPVIVARSGGLPENIVDGVSGRSFEAGDAAALATILGELVADRAALAALSRGAAARASDYGFDRFVGRLDAMAEAVVAAKRLPATMHAWSPT